MKNAIILHGAPEKEHYYDPDKPSESNAHWLPWLQKELMVRDIKADTPEIPYAFEPKWQLWCREVERFDMTSATALVGHSCGGGFWLKYLSLHPELTVDKVVLVAPWLDPDRTLQEKSFLAFDIDSGLMQRTAGVIVYYAVDDSDNVLGSIDRIRRELPDATYREFPKGYGHFTYENLSGITFPELRDELLAG